MTAERVFVGLGSNVGRRERFLARALAALDVLPGTRVVAASPVYETSPVGPRQRAFLNMAAELRTSLAPAPLLKAMKAAERRLGRVRRRRWGPREIDLDLLAYGRRRVDSGGLVLPHPRMAERKFVLKPLSDLAPRYRPALARLTAPDQRVTLFRRSLPWTK